MSYFSPDVIAKEQLHGVVGAPAITVTVSSGWVKPRYAIGLQPQPFLSLDVLQLLKQWLEIKVRRKHENE